MTMPTIHKILATTALCLAAVGVSSLTAGEIAPPSLVGKMLVMNIKGTEKCYKFADANIVRKTCPRKSGANGAANQIWKETYYVYSPETSEFYEESRINSVSGKVQDGYGYTRWRLQFDTVSEGSATLIAKHHFSLRHLKVGQSVSFRIEPLSSNLHISRVQENPL